MIKKVSLPAMVLTPADVTEIKGAVKEELAHWINSSTPSETAVLDDMSRAITSAVLYGFVTVGKRHEAA